MLAGYASLAWPHALPNNAVGLKGSGAVKNDIYNVKCYDDGSGSTAKLFFHIQTKGNPDTDGPVVSINAKKGAAIPGLILGAKDSDKSWASPTELEGGDGDYTVVVSKSAYKGPKKEHLKPQVYVGVAHCQTQSGGHTGTDIIMLQNE